MNTAAHAKGDSVKCTAHNGEHVGTVVHVIVPGALYGVAWDRSYWLTDIRVTPEFGRAHAEDITVTKAHAITGVGQNR